MEDISKIIPPGSNTAYNVRDAQARTDIAGKISDNPTFSEASTRANIASGESISTLFGKIKKFFSDLKTVAFTGSYNDLSNKPTLGTAAAKDVASSGNASSTQVVMGNDSRLSDSRPASDVSSWAKASTKPTYTASEVGLGNVGNFKAVSTVASQGLSDTEKSNARTNIGAGTSSFSGSYNDLTNKPTIPVKALWVDMGTISSLPTTKSASGCQTDMVCAKAELGTPSAQTGTWTINTDTAGKVTVSGTISGSTTLKLLLVPEDSVTAT